ncbi:ribonuclease HII [Brevibacterium litoralis]|uniref:ribonuclease HII n=1 Tax=Brevibacterium litoralis TaxID=3138935 RepID=UPI0032EAAFE1
MSPAATEARTARTTGGRTGSGRSRSGRTRAGLTDLTLERSLFEAGHRSVIGMDEVGRGCIAGPVGVGAVRFDLERLLAGPIPAGIDDSKKIAASRRGALADTVRDWQPDSTVAYADPAEIDALGMTMALCLAGRRALAALPTADLVLLDGSFDWLSAPLTLDAHPVFGPAAEVPVPTVRTVVKGDGTHVTIAAASLVSKVDRDALMSSLAVDVPGYGWDSNAGYPSPAHKQAVRDLGVTVHHRRSFRLS